MSSPLRVLIIEDSEDDTLLLVRELRRSGREVVWERVETAEQMKNALERDSWDLVISDYSMPHFSAPKALESFKETGLDLPFIVVSGKVGEDVAVETMKAGAHDFFLKGSFTRLVHAVKRELEQAAQRRARRKVEEAHAQLAAIVEFSSDAIIGRTLDATVTAWNAGAERLYGYSAEEAIGRPVTLHVPADRAGEIAGNLVRIRRGEVVDNFETVRLRKDGTRIEVSLAISPIRSSAGEVIGSSTIARDITERKRTEESIRKLLFAVEQAENVIFMTDVEGLITYVNPSFETLYGYGKGEVLGQTPRILKSGRQEAAFYREFWDKLLSGAGVQTEIVNRTRDGSFVTVETSANPVSDNNGKLIGFIAVQHDVSQRRLLEGQIRASQRMEAIGRLAGGVAHDFNNLLTVILGYSDVVRNQLPADHPLREEVEEIRKAGERAAGLTRQLLAFSRMQVLVPQVLDVNSVVKEIDRMLQRLIGEDVDLLTVCDPEAGRVKADPGQLEQVLMNLAVNARDAMPNGGKLTIETRAVELDEAYVREHTPMQPGPHVMLAVSDTGVGMDAETKTHIFEPFFTTKEKGKGTGLGLATVYGIVKQSGGFIWVYSEPGHGTTFKIYLPRIGDEPGAPARLAPPVEASALSSETILLVEDEETVRRLARSVLEKAGYTVLETSGWKSALEVAAKHPGPIHLVLTDVVMPGMAGPEVASCLSPLHPGIKVLYMSGYTSHAAVHRGLLDADVALVQKPFTPAELARRVRQLLDTTP